MGDPRGFLKVMRHKPRSLPVADRVLNYREFVVEPSRDELRAQASRCMDCGIPFCHKGCPLGNVIPDFNDLVYRGDFAQAIRVLHSTNNFPEVTGRVCPAPCEASCVLNIDGSPVTIKDVERAIANEGFAGAQAAALAPVIAPSRSGFRVAIVGSGPAGLAAAQQLARLGHDVVVFERDEQIGGLLRFGIPDFKMEKTIIDRRVEQMTAEGVRFQVGADVGGAMAVSELTSTFDAIVLCIGARVARDLPIAGRQLEGVAWAMDFLAQQNRHVAALGDAPSGTDTLGNESDARSTRARSLPSSDALLATDKHVVVIGGGDTGADCVGTANRQRARSVVQLELMPKPPLVRMPDNPWPAWPAVLRTSSSHEEGCDRVFAVMTKAFVPDETGSRVARIAAVRAEIVDNRVHEVPGSEFEIPCDLALLAMGFTGPERAGLVSQLKVRLDERGAIVTDSAGATSVPSVFAAGDASRGQSLVVWAIADGRRVAAGVDAFLMNSTRVRRTG